MRINHNMMAMNTHRQLTVVNSSQGKAMEKLSSGYRINRAGDDAAGLAISEKMRAQVRGLNQASRNALDGISLIQTAEGALTETHAILQRMRELAVQSVNDTNVEVDRGSLQDEVAQLKQEIDRIGNTTEFNTQKLLQGDGNTVLAKTGLAELAGDLSGGTSTYEQASYSLTVADLAAGTTDVTASFTIQGETITLTGDRPATAGTDTDITVDEDSATGNAVTINMDAGDLDADETATKIAEALNLAISKNSKLAGNFKVEATDDDIKITAISKDDGGKYYGDLAHISRISSADITASGLLDSEIASDPYVLGTATHEAATLEMDFLGVDADELVGTAFTVGDKTFEFFNSAEGEYKGDAIGIDIKDALAVAMPELTGTENNDERMQFRATTLNKEIERAELIAEAVTTTIQSSLDGDNYSVAQGTDKVGHFFVDNDSSTDGTAVTYSPDNITAFMGYNPVTHADYRNDMTVANTHTVVITSKLAGEAGNDSLKVIDGRVQEDFTAEFQIGANANQTLNVTMGDMRTEALGIDGVDISTKEGAKDAIKTVDGALEMVSKQRSSLGAFQNRLEHTIKNLDTSAENLQSAESRIRDVDMAKEMMEFTKNNILQQASQAMLAQANQAPQGVLQLLR